LGESGLYGFGSLAGMLGPLTNDYKVTFSALDERDIYEETVDATGVILAITFGLGYQSPYGFGLSIGYRLDGFGEAVAENEYEDFTFKKMHNESARVLQGLNLTLSYTL